MKRSSRIWLAVLSAVLFVVIAFGGAAAVDSSAQSNWDAAESAPQQSAAAGVATTDALVMGLYLFGVFGALTFVNLAAAHAETKPAGPKHTFLAGYRDNETAGAAAMSLGAGKGTCPHCNEPWQRNPDGTCAECGKLPGRRYK